MEQHEHIRALVEQIGLSQRAIAKRLGIHEATFRKYLMGPACRSRLDAPYLVQFALEAWAAGHEPEE